VAALRLGLTGGIGSGKSTVGQMLAERGATLIDADAISRATTATGGIAIAPIRKAFGAGVITAQGALDRDAMRALVFSDPSAKARLEGIIHPLVGLEIAAQAHRAEDAGAVLIVFDIPLLVESAHWRRSLHKVLVVDCQESTQVARVAARNGLSTADIAKIIAAQAPRSQRLAAADIVLYNDGLSLDQLAYETGEIATRFGL
jgi:dephospho-CoA kinase